MTDKNLPHKITSQELIGEMMMVQAIILFSTFVFLFCYSLAGSTAVSSSSLLYNSQQLLLVRTNNWDAFHATMQQYQRDTLQHPWVAAGSPISVVVGKNGLAWGVDIKKNHLNGPIKKEGDSRTPIGIFKISQAFGFATSAEKEMKLPYLAIRDTTICVDDVASPYYNQVVDQPSVTKLNWKSAEQMREVPGYKWGAIIQYNTNLPIPAAGSCIFLHIWKSETTGTAGCVAMHESTLKEILTWLDPKKEPTIAILTEQEFQRVKKE